MTEKTIFIRKIAGGRFPKKCRLGPQNGFESLGPEKLLKIVNYAIIKETKNDERNNGGGPGGLGRWPPISTWINDGGSFSPFPLPFGASREGSSAPLSCLEVEVLSPRPFLNY